VTAISNNELAAKRNGNTVRILPPPMFFLYRHWLNDRSVAPIPSHWDLMEPMGT
jgi:hypothetical protein